MDSRVEVKPDADTSKSIQVDEHVILTVEENGSIRYATPVTGKTLYETIDKAEKRIAKLVADGKSDDAHRETLHLFMAVTLFEISRLRADLAEEALKACRSAQ